MNQKTFGIFLGLLTIFMWGSLATFGNLLIHLPPFYILGITFLIASIPGLFKPREFFPSIKMLAWGVFGYFGYHFCLFYSFRFAPAIEANLINYLWPVLLVLFTPMVLPNQSLRIHHIIGAILSVLGCVLLIHGKGGSLSLENIYGYFLALGAALIWPIYSLGKIKFKAIPVWSIGSSCLVTSLLCFATHYLIEPRVVLQSHDAWKLILMGIGPFGIAFYSWDLALRKGEAKIIGALAYLTPVISTLGLVFFAGQEMGTSTLVAMIFIICGASSGLLDLWSARR